ncbi:hypothetical protein Taro_053133 [Colocasia esculenta]|uniref:Senescence regulator n=1 Tax=Colocasia esculenta TaxID=4460 RepID=A0A843XK38_COLES|nr:hypothetical protein [Colocasia esculenta]
MASLPSSFRGKNGLSSVRFLGVLKQPDSPLGRNPTSNSGDRRSEDGNDDDTLELDEGDVLWSAASYEEISDSHSPVGSAGPNSPLSNASTGRSASSLSPSGNYPNPRPQRDGRGRRAGRPFTPERFGLSAALAEEPGPLVQQRKTSLDPSAAARTVPPVAVPRAGLGADGYSTAKVFGQSAPVNVPVWPRKLGRRAESTLSVVDDWMEEREWDEEGDDGEMVPPHLIVARSHGMSFSVFEGVGRTLKGRDLRQVRNAVFQKTGFLD